MNTTTRLVGALLCATALWAAPLLADEPAANTADEPIGGLNPPAERDSAATGPGASSTTGAPPARREERTASPASREPPPIVPGNPAASTVLQGTGELGQLLGVARHGIRVGASSLTGATLNMLGGVRPGQAAAQNLFLLDVSADLGKLCGWKGATIDVVFLDHHGAPASALTGDVQGFESLDGPPPLSRDELYQWWLFQTFLQERVSVRIGKLVPSYQFANIADVTGLIMTPIFVMPTVLGFQPGYPDSAAGITLVGTPAKSWYLQFGFYDGRIGASGVPTGLHAPAFNGDYFAIGEAGIVSRLGPTRLEGKLGVGAWGQTGQLKRFDGGSQDGTTGLYLFAKQHLWYENPGVDLQGATAYLQLGLADRRVQLVPGYLGAGVAWSGFLPRRNLDSVGVGVAWGHLTDEPGARNRFPQFPTGHPSSNEVILQGYYQRVLSKNLVLQPTLTYIIDPGSNSSIPNAVALTQHVGLRY